MLLEVFSSRPYCSLEEGNDELVGKTTETILDVNKFLEEMEI